ncbi:MULTISPECIES: B12-binding domain-containing radical SAM protein [Mycobacterium]|uniref:B12-binding domain-containing radical SAM protein n=2 Tax=Mycobacterium TaxID=1763 RepID=A0A1W9ZHH3_MYCAN|nr:MULTISPECIES: radical SAM protein [Mycobacterium]MCV7076201.1 B12-binding domain-containing radical SAM protein [Mycobacterium szulgai]MCV7195643.1 B12-binding domain-containing radical SAM protein [Mycobacterium angelicum]ORA15160.1 B12-binding domain-containing radical SAM protein [Mycobacterium angelicum]ORW90128.1 radical SAM protein [Mycobacterium szulgai]
MTVLLVNPPGARPDALSFVSAIKRTDPSRYSSMPVEHLGMMSIKAYAKAQGIEITCVNGLVDGHVTVAETWQAMENAVGASGTPRLVGFSCIDTLPEVLWLAQRARQAWAGVRIVIGHAIATLNYERILRQHDCFDYVVVGDGEQTFTRLALAVVNDAAAEDIPGLARRDERGQIVYVPAPLIDLDELPPAARDELPTVLADGFAASVFSTRGCPYRCTFCGTGAMSGMFGKDSYRAKSVDVVVDEIAALASNFDIDFYSITDDLFVSKHPSSQQRAADFADAVLRRGLDIKFMIDIRLDSVVDLALFKHLHRAGLHRVFIGLETGSYDQLRSYRKQILGRGKDAADTVQSLQELGIEIIAGTIMFHPTVRPEELRETVRLLLETRNGLPFKLMGKMVPYPGTPLYQAYSDAGYLTSEWPLGQWDFVDPEASRFYSDVEARIGPDPELTFDEASAFFLSRLDEWEDVIARRTAEARA